LHQFVNNTVDNLFIGKQNLFDGKRKDKNRKDKKILYMVFIIITCMLCILDLF